MFGLMRAAYTLERARGSDVTTRDVLRMATIEGAEVAGLGEVAGSLRAGKQADLVLVRADALATAPAHDPVGALVLSADTGCVDTVLVAGRVVKRDGRLLHHDVPAILASLRESAAHVAA
jgi:cytosine/adenosine deaminase-related metal-dependent hydrolase